MNDLDVREIREKSGLTQEELAERMGMYKENMYRLGTYQSGQI
jgi:transcriptional regulator with XRE-family HTH domain